jgi:uncharacterized protein YcbK (DUF882 family)
VTRRPAAAAAIVALASIALGPGGSARAENGTAAPAVPAPAAPPQRLPSSTPYRPGEVAPATPPAEPAPAPVAAPSKKDLYLAAKRAAAGAARPVRPAVKVGAPAAKVISLFNTWTHEWIAVDAKGALPDPSLVARFLRCHYTNRPTSMDPRLIGAVVNAARHFSARRVDIVSGFRHPKYNLMLRKKGREVARDSQHTLGHAVDFRLPGVAVGALHRWAISRRMGGVGLYLDSGFVHMDIGPVRYWGGD